MLTPDTLESQSRALKTRVIV